MASSATPRRRPINPQALVPYSAELTLAHPVVAPSRRGISIGRDQLVPVIQAQVGAEFPVPAYQYRLFVPVAEVIWESPTTCRRVTIATDEDIGTLRDLLIRDFGGVTTLKQNPSPLQGSGARDPRRAAATLEQNEHVAFEVLAAANHHSDIYFSALRRELQDALGEGVILIQRYEVSLIGCLVPARPDEPST